jgi:hypothetical protein
MKHRNRMAQQMKNRMKMVIWQARCGRVVLPTSEETVETELEPSQTTRVSLVVPVTLRSTQGAAAARSAKEIQ